MSKELSVNGKALVHSIAVWLRDEMLTHLTDSAPSPNMIWDGAQSNFEISCSALSQIGVFEREGHYWCVLDQTRDLSISPDKFTHENLDFLLDAVACHSHYVECLYKHDEAVIPKDVKLTKVCEALVECGYMDRISSDTFEWTDAFGPWMVANDAWQLEDFEAASQDEVRAALIHIPDQDKELLLSRFYKHRPVFVRYFCSCWTDGAWVEKPRSLVPNDNWDIILAAGVYAQLHG